MKRVVVLGSTGSIGTQTLDVISQFPDELQVVGLAAGRNEALVREQAARLGVQHVALFQDSGVPGLVALATLAEADLVVVSVAGVIGLEPTVAAIRAGKHIALASKEVLVAAGEAVMPLVREAGVSFTPIDSEHSALFQCMQGYRSDQVEEMILTASGGPFRGRTTEDLRSISVAEALNHPTWRMGGKITIDSATLMNKALEMIEARWLFDVAMDQVRVVVHPQSVVHSMVKFRDGSVLGQMGWPDMRLPIAYALLYPERRENHLRPWNPVETPTLTFEALDEKTFRGPSLAREAMRRGGTTACAFNALNEEAVAAFLAGELGFLEIYDLVEQGMEGHVATEASLPNLLAADAESRRSARNLIEAMRGSRKP